MDFSRAEIDAREDRLGKALPFNVRSDAGELALLRVNLAAPQAVAFFASIQASLDEAARIDWCIYAGASGACRPSEEPCAEGSTYLGAGESRTGLVFEVRRIASTYLLSVQSTGGGRIHGTLTTLASPPYGDSSVEAGPVIG